VVQVAAVATLLIAGGVLWRAVGLGDTPPLPK
jgi:hypothetical protein